MGMVDLLDLIDRVRWLHDHIRQFSSTTLTYSLVPDVAIPILLVAIAPRVFKRSPRFVSGP